MTKHQTQGLSISILKRDMPDITEMTKSINKLGSYADRELVILGGAYLEGALELALKAKFKNLTEKDIERIFNPQSGGLLSTFESKILIAFELGIVSSDMREDLAIIKEIRNIYAHTSFRISLVDEPIISKLSSFKIVNFATVKKEMEKTKKDLVEMKLMKEEDMEIFKSTGGMFSEEEGWTSLDEYMYLITNEKVPLYVPEPRDNYDTKREYLVSAIQLIWFLLMLVGIFILHPSVKATSSD
jgi:hypothetical protein